MTKYGITAPVALGIINRTSTSVTGYTTKFTTVDNALTATDTALKNSERVKQAMGDLVTHVVSPYLTKVAGHSSSAVQGVRDAIGYYKVGDMDMFRTAQTNATKATYPTGMPGKGPSHAIGGRPAQ